MSALAEVAYVAAGAAVGAPMRYLLGQRLDSAFPYGTLVANTVASLMLGISLGWALDGAAVALIATGFCGGLSTYSSFAVQTRDLGPAKGSWYAATTIGLGLLACTAGLLLVP